MAPSSMTQEAQSHPAPAAAPGPWAFLLVTLAVALVGALLLRDLSTSHANERQGYSECIRGLELLGDLQYHMQEARRAFLYALATSDSNRQVEYADQSRAAEALVAPGLAACRRMARSQADLQAHQKLEADWAAYLRVRDEIIAAILEGNARAAVERDLAEGIPAFNELREDLNNLKLRSQREASQLLRRLEANSRDALIRLAVTLALTLLCALVVMKSIQKSSLLRAVQSSEARLRRDLESISEEVIVLDPAGLVVSWNNAAEASWSIPRAVILNRPLLDALPELGETPLSDAITTALERTQGSVLEDLTIHYQGGARSYEARVFPFQGGASIILDDVTSQKHAEEARKRVNRQLGNEVAVRKRAEDALRQSQQRFEAAVAGSSDGIWDWDLITNDIYFSPRWKYILGYEDGELANEYDAWITRLHPEDRDRVLGALQDYLTGRASIYEVEFRLQHKDGSYRWILARGAARRSASGKPYRMAGSHTDITARKQAEAQMAELNQQLLEASRQAGMAEVATGVLHNVGNVLNSINVSATLVNDHLRQSKLANLVKSAALLREHKDDLAGFLMTDPKGKVLPGYLIHLAEHLTAEQAVLSKELVSVTKNVEHIKAIVALQQGYAKVPSLLQSVALDVLLQDALQINAAAFQRCEVQVTRQIEPAPPVFADKHKVLQILVNLLRNAREAMAAVPAGQRCLRVGIARQGADQVKVTVHDNGVGIAPENLARIFNHGFTTKPEGHGFGLHSGAIAAQEMGGSLTAQSEGEGRGATFTLELPVALPHGSPLQTVPNPTPETHEQT